MWPWTDWKLRRALRRYRRERDLEAVLQMDWHRDLDLSAFFADVEERLHGEEITRLRQKQAEYLALQNQINPHFLYNALEAIRTDALLANCPDIAETTEALATFFRYTISNVQEYVTFSDELDNAENYFTIQRCRFGDKISLELELENERLLEVRMPKLILQPLVENAVSHGLEGKLGHGTVRIIVENSESTAQLNALLHDAGQYIIGRMGLPYRAKGVSIISVVLDAPQDVISALAGRIGRLPGVSAKTAYSKPFPPAGD